MRLERLAADVSRHCALERAWFEILGGWVPTTADPEVKLQFAQQSHHHAWHAELWAGCFPDAYGFDLESACRAATSQLAPFLDACRAESDGVGRLVAAYRIVGTAKIAAYDAWADQLDDVGAGATRRWLEKILADEIADLRAGLGLLSRRLQDGSAVANAASRQVRLESLLWEAGGVSGR
ncbi:MAG: hypothetical protein OEY23_07775 [Acidimicrobiia bacterium]|nr:hypothetical protein [Acidimicrobiia bacterium]